MTRPTTEAEYLASLIPSSVRAQEVSRRGFLRGASGVGALVLTPALLAACGGGDSSPSASGGGGGAVSGAITFGSNYSDKNPKAALAAVTAAFQTANAGTEVKINTIDHNTFQENITTYLSGTPDDVYAWFAGYRMRFFAAKGLAGDVSDVWPIEGMSDAMKKSSTGDDGKQYFVPANYYPWAVFYRKSVFADKGYAPPKTLDEFTALGAQMKKDGLIPVAFAAKDQWAPMGTFDQLNMRINGYDYHVALMAGTEDWAGPKVKAVFDAWRGLLEIHQADSLGRTWQEAAQAVQKKEAGMYLLGSFVAQQFAGEEDDLDFFNFPEVDSAIGSDAVEAPIDGFMMNKRPKNEAGAKALLKFMGSAPAQDVFTKADPSVVAANGSASTAAYSALQKKSAEFVAAAKSISQFLDRDTRPDFASTVMGPAIGEFIKAPTEVDSLLASIQKQKVSIFGS